MEDTSGPSCTVYPAASAKVVSSVGVFCGVSKKRRYIFITSRPITIPILYLAVF